MSLTPPTFPDDIEDDDKDVYEAAYYRGVVAYSKWVADDVEKLRAAFDAIEDVHEIVDWSDEWLGMLRYLAGEIVERSSHVADGHHDAGSDEAGEAIWEHRERRERSRKAMEKEGRAS